ncbi:7tm 6 domain containing protein, partial [Asbolus verrucosus]
MTDAIKRSFNVNLSVMQAFGLYSAAEESTCLYKVMGYSMYCLFMFPIPIFGTLYLVLDENFDMMQLNDNAFLIAEIVCQFTKLFPFIHNANRIKTCIHYFEAPFFLLSRQKQLDILNKYSRICQRNSKLFLSAVITINIIWASKPLFGKEYKLPVDLWLPFELVAEPRAYYSIYLFLVIAVAYASIACAAIDPLIAGLACQAAGQLEILKDNLQHLSEYVDEEILEHTADKKSKQMVSKIRHCIQHHNAILHFASEYRDCFSSAVFGQFAGSVLVTCFCCLQLSKSNNLTDAIYMGNWYEYDAKSKKALTLLMEHSKRPIIITVGKIVELSLITFTTESTCRCKMQVYVMYLLISAPIPILGTIYFILGKNIDAERTTDNAFVLSQAAFCFLKWLPFIINGDGIKKCIHYFELPCFLMELNIQQKRIIEKKGYIVWAIRPLFAKHKRLPVDIWLPFDCNSQEEIFYSVYLFIAAEIFYIAVATAVVDPLIGGLACLAIGHIKILKDNLQHLNEYAEEEISTEYHFEFSITANKTNLKSKIIQDKIKKCINYHNAILEFIKLYEKSFSSVVFSQFMGSSFQICTCCLQMGLFKPLSFSFFSVLSYIGIMLTQIYFYCYYGTVLFEESNSLTNAIYTGEWYEYDIKSKKSLLILMECSKSPITVSAGKIIDLSLTTFTMEQDILHLRAL